MDLEAIEKVKREILDAGRSFYCEDNPAIKERALEINRGISPEARALHGESVVIDACSFFLEDYNWHLEESGATALNCTVPGVMDGRGEAVKKIIDYHQTIRSSEKLTLVERAGDILDAKREGRIGIIIGAQSCEFVFHPDLHASTEVFARMGLRIMQIGYSHRTFAADRMLYGGRRGVDFSREGPDRRHEPGGSRRRPKSRRCPIDAGGDGLLREASDLLAQQSDCPLSPSQEHHGRADQEGGRAGRNGGHLRISSIHWDQTDRRPCLDTFLDSISYVADLVGVDHVGIGLDSNAQPGAYDRRELLSMGQGHAAVTGPNYYLHFHLKGMTEQSFYSEGIVNLANLPNVTDGLLTRGFGREEIQKILGRNYLRVFEQWWD